MAERRQTVGIDLLEQVALVDEVGVVQAWPKRSRPRIAMIGAPGQVSGSKTRQIRSI
jgi:hypothetical protein